MAPPVPPAEMAMRRTASRHVRIVPVTFTLTTWPMRLAAMSASRETGPIVPAFTTTASIGPSSAAASSNSRTTSFSAATSHWTVTALLPAARTASATFSALASSRTNDRATS